MTTITEETNLDAVSTLAAAHANTAGAPEHVVGAGAPVTGSAGPATTDGADNGEIELELQQMEDAATTLDQAFEHVAAGDRTDLADHEHLANLDQT